jgi:lysophospholipase L1-like esterase
VSLCRLSAGPLLASVLAIAACHPASRPGSGSARRDPAPVPANGPGSSEQTPVVPPPPPPLSADEVPPVDATLRPLPELGAFYEKLDALRHGKTQDRPLRVLWLGDSHTSADFLTHRVRAHLQGLVGDAGPGFLRLGLEPYRHEAASFEITGRFRHEPVLPAQRTRVKDGVFGYGGIRTLPQAGARVKVSVRMPGVASGGVGSSGVGSSGVGSSGVGSSGVGSSGATSGAAAALRWRLSYRLPEGAVIDVRVGQTERRLSSSVGDGPAILSADFEGGAADTFELSHVAGAPEIFGVFAERASSGLVLDTVGIDGARAATPLAWAPEQFERAVAERSPALVVVAYGTNEVFDKGRADQYAEHTLALIERVRAGAGPIPCWVIGPMDASGPGGQSRPRVSEISLAQADAARQAGCAFTSAQAVMGGEGSFARWTTQRPQLARTDGIHLTIAGYRQLGDLLAERLVTLAPQPSEAQPLQPQALQP